MAAGYLLNRILLKFNQDLIHQDLSALKLVEGYLWMASDEMTSVERLSRLDLWTFGEQRSFGLSQFLTDFSPEDAEVDIEGFAYADGYLWIVGSHSTKRKKIKNTNTDRLTTVKAEKNRYLLARVPLVQGELQKSYENLTAAYLERNENGNLLMSALKADAHLGPFLSGNMAIPGKDNGFDIEGIAVWQNKILLGLRGPVLRGVAILLELEVEDSKAGFLRLKPIGKKGELYKKHFLELDGFGIRDLCGEAENLLILAGPTMDLDGTLRLFRLSNPLALAPDSLSKQKPGELEALFDIPHGRGTDRAEGVTLFPILDQTRSILVVYDSPDVQRQIQGSNVLADVFTLE